MPPPWSCNSRRSREDGHYLRAAQAQRFNQPKGRQKDTRDVGLPVQSLACEKR